MAHKRTNFTEKQKAKIFARDRATCAFSGISVWLFDQGIRPNFDTDWADHIIPSAKGGTSELSNGVCASSFFNAKKKDNGSDNKFFFINGQITETYITVYGVAPDRILADLKRRQSLVSSDWYLNRSIANTFYAFDWRCYLEFYDKRYVRDDAYCYKTALRMHRDWNKDKETPSIENRNMLKADRPFGCVHLLEIQNIKTKEQYIDWAETIWPIYRTNWQAYQAFIRSETADDKQRVYDQFCSNTDANPQLIQGLGQLLSSSSTEDRKTA